MFGGKSSVRALRRGWPIHGYVGPNGSGKSLAMVWDSLPSLRAGRVVLSTVRLLDYENPRPCEGWRWSEWDQERADCEICAALLAGESDRDGLAEHRQAHRLWEPFTKWDPLLDKAVRHFDVLMDEVTGVASSRESHAMPAPVANSLVQLRRRDVTLRWSAPNWARSDKIIRECSQAVTHCTGHLPVRVSDPDGTERLWRNRRLFRWRTYDAQGFDEFTEGKRTQLSSMAREFFWGPGSVVFDAYDTFDAVLSIGTVTEGGSCYRCGGSRPRPRCKCGGHDEATAGATAEAGPPEGVPEQSPGRRARRPDPLPRGGTR